MKEINILWFKKDLRIHDNEALCEAIKNNDILPIYIIELDIWSLEYIGTNAKCNLELHL